MKKIICLCLVFLISAAFLKLPAAAKPELSAASAILMEAQTGRVIYAVNEHEKRPMASTTKIMTTLLTLESGDLDEKFTIDSRALITEGSSMYLHEGDRVTKRELCYGMMLPSGNDAANAAALKLAGEYADFAAMMNDRALKTGMHNTSFVTPSGLHDDMHYSTAYDMALLAREAMKNDDFRKICSTKFMKLSDESWSEDKYLTNSNKLLSRYDGCIGIKTGFTDEAGRCLVSAAERNGVTLIAVTLKAPDDWNDHIKMMDYGFRITAAEKYDGCTAEFSVPVAGGISDSVKGVLKDFPVITAVNGNIPIITEVIRVPRFEYAPVLKGDVIGTAEYYAENELVFSSEIIADESCSIKEAAVEQSLYSFIVDKLKGLFLLIQLHKRWEDKQISGKDQITETDSRNGRVFTP